MNSVCKSPHFVDTLCVISNVAICPDSLKGGFSSSNLTRRWCYLTSDFAEKVEGGGYGGAGEVVSREGCSDWYLICGGNNC